MRKEKEQERQRDEERKEGIWDYNGESGEWYWTGEKEPEYHDEFCHTPPTEEQTKMANETEQKLFAEFVEYKAKM